MRGLKKICLYCGGKFVPRPNIGGRQKACGMLSCLRVRKKEADRKWHYRNRVIHLQMIRDWFLAHPGYLKEYRKNHPEYRLRNIQATQNRKAKHYQILFDKKTSKLASTCLSGGKGVVLPFDKKTHSPVDSP